MAVIKGSLAALIAGRETHYCKGYACGGRAVVTMCVCGCVVVNSSTVPHSDRCQNRGAFEKEFDALRKDCGQAESWINHQSISA